MSNTKGLKRGGSPGRPKGVPNKATREIKAFCQQLFERPKFQRAFKQQWDAMTLDPGTLREMLHYAFGKPTTSVEVTAGGDLARLLARDFEDEE